MTTSKVEKKIGVVFKDKGLLEKAFMHRSFLNETPDVNESNERLEFLGDAVLEFTVSEHLFKKFEKQDEGHLTALRAKLVNTIALAEVARELGLGDELNLSRGEERSGGRKNNSLLANTIEALIGAIFLDQGIDKAREFVAQHILSRVGNVVKESLKDSKSNLQEFVQTKGKLAPKYRTVSQAGPDHAKTFKIEVVVDGKVLGEGSGLSKQIAEQKAAEAALKEWNKQT